MARDRATRGILLGVLAYGLFALHDATIKVLVQELPVWQVSFVRSVVVFGACCAIGRRRLLERAAATPLKRTLVFRGTIAMLAWICYYTAARSLPLGQLTSLYFAAPLIVTALATPLLGEAVTPARWGAVCLGFLGVLLASDPFGVRAGLPALLVLIAAALWGYAIILMRQIARRESTLLQMLFMNAVFLLGTGIVSAPTWQHPNARQLLLLLLVGVLGGLGQFSVVEAARFAPASVLATVEYSGLLWAFLLGYAIWGDVPPSSVLAGAGVIVLAGMLLLGAERRASRPA